MQPIRTQINQWRDFLETPNATGLQHNMWCMIILLYIPDPCNNSCIKKRFTTQCFRIHYVAEARCEPRNYKIIWCLELGFWLYKIIVLRLKQLPTQNPPFSDSFTLLTYLISVINWQIWMTSMFEEVRKKNYESETLVESSMTKTFGIFWEYFFACSSPFP